MEATDIQNQSQLAKALGVGRAAISLVKQKNTVPPRWILLLSRAYDLDPVWLAGEDQEPETELEPSAAEQEGTIGVPWVQPELDPATGRLQRAPQPAWPSALSWLQTLGTPETMVVLTAASCALEPTILPGSMLLVDESRQTPLDGGIFLLAVNAGIALRRVWLHPQGLYLQGGPAEDVLGLEDVDLLGQLRCSIALHAGSV